MVQAAPQAKRRKLGGFGHRALKCTLSRSSAWELKERSSGVERWGPGTASRLGGPACRHERRSRWFGTGQRGVSALETAQAAPRAAVGAGLRARGCAAAARMVPRNPAARKAAQVKVRSKFCAKNVEAATSSKLALAEELATLGGCEPIYSLTEVTLLTVAKALDSAGYMSASSFFAEVRHIELDFAISPALDRAFKKVIDAVTRSLGPVKKAPEVKLSAIQHNTDTMIVGTADAYVISLHWLLRADETDGLSLGMASLILHEEVSGPGDVTLRLPTSKTDPRGNGASRMLTCIGELTRCPTPALCGSPPDFPLALVVWLGDRR